MLYLVTAIFLKIVMRTKKLMTVMIICLAAQIIGVFCPSSVASKMSSLAFALPEIRRALATLYKYLPSHAYEMKAAPLESQLAFLDSSHM